MAGVPVLAIGAWSALEAQPIVVNGLPVLEQACCAPSLKRLREAGADASLIAQVRSDLKWPTEAVTALQRSAPGTLAKILNVSGVPTTFKDELASLPAVALLFQHHNAVAEKLDIIIAKLEDQKKSREEAKTAPKTTPPLM